MPSCCAEGLHFSAFIIMATIMNNAGPAGTKNKLHQNFQAAVCERSTESTNESSKPKPVSSVVMRVGKLLLPKVPWKVGRIRKRPVQEEQPGPPVNRSSETQVDKSVGQAYVIIE